MRFIFSLIFVFQILLLVGCDKGRVIDQKERDKVLTGDGNDKTDFGQNLQIYPDHMSPQSEYGFVIYNSQSRFYAPVSLLSLLKFENGKPPVLQFLDRKVDMTCLEERENKNNGCANWSYSFNLNSISSSAPSTAFEIKLSPLKKYSLKSQVGESFVKMADYDTFLLTFNWPDARFAYIVAKQNFYVDADLVKSQMSFITNDNFTPLFAASYFWPNPSYLYSLHKVEIIKTEPLSLEFNGVFENIKTEELSRVHYLLEAL